VLIITDGADKADFMPKSVCVPGEVERRASQVLRGRKDVPEYFANGDDLKQTEVGQAYLETMKSETVPKVRGAGGTTFRSPLGLVPTHRGVRFVATKSLAKAQPASVPTPC
jgi:hypothetical protein